MPTQVGLAPIVRVTIKDPKGNPIELGDKLKSFEWTSFINGGYSIKAVFYDHLYNRINELAAQFYLENSRNIPLQASFQLGWGNTLSGALFTSKLTAFITQIAVGGVNNSAEFGLEAIDPASYILYNGRGDGSARKGNLSSVIKSVIDDATTNVTSGITDIITGEQFKLHIDVSKTNDSKNGTWYTMQMDPMTFIKSSLEWSSSLTDDKSMWVIASGMFKKDDDAADKETQKESEIPAIFIKQWPELYSLLPANKRDLFVNVNTSTPNQNDVVSIDFIGNNFISASSTELRTGGISSTTGAFYDYKTTKKTIVNDEQTPRKLNIKDLDKTLSYTKPKSSSGGNFINKGVTRVGCIPEMNGGELGVNYVDYIDGRARQSYLDMLSNLMRIKVRVFGWHLIDDSRMLGTTVIGLNLKDSSKNDSETSYFLSGRWMLYGFKHIISRNGNWYTDLFLFRLDHDSNAEIKVPIT